MARTNKSEALRWLEKAPVAAEFKVSGTRKAWQKINVELAKREETAAENVKKALYGTDTANPGLAAWREKLRRELIDRGRVWRDCAVTGVQKQPPAPGSENATTVVNLRTAPAVPISTGPSKE